MTELAGQCSGQIKEKELALTDNRLDVAAEQIEEEHVAEQMPRAIVEKSGGEELPPVGRAQPLIAQSQILAGGSWVVSVEEKLRHENGYVRADPSEKKD